MAGQYSACMAVAALASGANNTGTGDSRAIVREGGGNCGAAAQPAAPRRIAAIVTHAAARASDPFMVSPRQSGSTKFTFITRKCWLSPAMPPALKGRVAPVFLARKYRWNYPAPRRSRPSNADPPSRAGAAPDAAIAGRSTRSPWGATPPRRRPRGSA